MSLALWPAFPIHSIDCLWYNWYYCASINAVSLSSNVDSPGILQFLTNIPPSCGKDVFIWSMTSRSSGSRTPRSPPLTSGCLSRSSLSLAVESARYPGLLTEPDEDAGVMRVPDLSDGWKKKENRLDISFLYVCMVNTIYLLSFVETPRKFIIAIIN